ncbi:MAG: cupin domain-containing protein [Chloroflexi bacterium]|nr:cupin domain-containing protein [Chloroflexota bacterium]MBK6708803.1 cupin domain-containing protein [Chloroflexota bacterium]MBK7179248.1 cupin domain-containing protein [Chloroflexota bacterium]MBK7917159.1 cupin domain-containing protein [Chloroflexota bacterium]MBK8934380.1 cupin domain-containing protein [Chloroflexota bacterium]
MTSNQNPIQWADQARFAPDGPQPVKIIEDSTFRAVLVGLEAGQQIPTHPAPTSVYHIIQGEGWMTVDGERFAVSAGATITVPQGARRGFEATTRVVLLGAQAAN